MSFGILTNASLGTKDIANTTLYAPVKFITWSLRPPGAGLVLSGISWLGDYCANLQVFPGQLAF